jgi:hypothetical protein
MPESCLICLLNFFLDIYSSDANMLHHEIDFNPAVARIIQVGRLLESGVLIVKETTSLG